MKEKENTVVLFNKSEFKFITSKGNFLPNMTIEVGEKEANNLLTYNGVIDAKKMVTSKSVLQENEDLKRENEALRKQLKELQKDPETPQEVPETDKTEQPGALKKKGRKNV